MPSKPRLTPALELSIVIAFCILSRLPQLLSPQLMPDGDEAIVGLMAKHLHDGRELPLFFWGQAYGFSTIEAALCAAAFAIGGITDISMKAAMLLLWTVGVAFLYKTFKREAAKDSLWPLLLISLFILSPAWAVWSMKARGGYLTAFAGSAVVLWLLRNGGKSSVGRCFAIGALLALIFESQALWLAGLAPFVAYRILSGFAWRPLLAMLAGLLLLLLPLMYAQHVSAQYWRAEVFEFTGETFLANIRELPAHLFQSFSGHYYLQEVFAPTPASAVLAWMMVAAIVAIAGAGLYKLARGRRDGLFFVSLLSVLLTLFYALFLSGRFAPRYLLPLSEWVAVSLFFLLRNVRSCVSVVAVTAAILLTGAIAMAGFKDFAFQEVSKGELRVLLAYLKKQHVRHVFVKDGLMQWQLMFYSEERIIARYVSSTDRYPAYVSAVNEALRRGERTALIVHGELSGISLFKTGHCSVVIAPDRKLLKEQGFQFESGALP